MADEVVGLRPELDAFTVETVMGALTEARDGRAIGAIKFVKDRTGMGLKEAKDFCDRLRDAAGLRNTEREDEMRALREKARAAEYERDSLRDQVTRSNEVATVVNRRAAALADLVRDAITRIENL